MAIVVSQLRSIFAKDFSFVHNFQNLAQQKLVYEECLVALRKSTWNKSHFDSVISNYRETLLSGSPDHICQKYPAIWDLLSEHILPRITEFTMLSFEMMMEPHILELASNGCIAYHLDRV